MHAFGKAGSIRGWARYHLGRQKARQKKEAKPEPTKYFGDYRRTGEERAQYIADKRLSREEYIAELSRRDREGFNS